MGYEGLYQQQHGKFAMNESTGVFLYSRVMTFADCSRMTLSPELLSLCSTVPPAQRPVAQAYIWTPATPLDRFPPVKFSGLPNGLAQQFAIKAIEAQPLDYAKAVFDDTWQAFYWPRSAFPNAATYNEYLFGYHSLKRYRNTAAYYLRGDPLTQVAEPYAGVMRVYQRYVWLPGTLYGLILLAGLAALAWRWRRGGKDALLPWASSIALVVVPAATAEFDYRYVTTAVPFACLALAIGLGRRDGQAASSADASGAVDSGATDAEAADSVASGVAGPSGNGSAAGGAPASRAGGEAGGATGLPGGVARGSLTGGQANASHDKSDLTADAN